MPINLQLKASSSTSSTSVAAAATTTPISKTNHKRQPQQQPQFAVAPGGGGGSNDHERLQQSVRLQQIPPQQIPFQLSAPNPQPQKSLNATTTTTKTTFQLTPNSKSFLIDNILNGNHSRATPIPSEARFKASCWPLAPATSGHKEEAQSSSGARRLGAAHCEPPEVAAEPQGEAAAAVAMAVDLRLSSPSTANPSKTDESDSTYKRRAMDEASQRRNRTMFSDWQLSGLEWRFARNKYLTTNDRVRIAKLLDLNQLQVKTWFQVSSLSPSPSC